MAVIDSDETLAKWARAGNVAARALEVGKEKCVVGKPVLDAIEAVESFIADEGLGMAFPCTASINAVAAHWTPALKDDHLFQKGDLVKIDCGAELDGALSDNAVTVEVGSNEQADLIKASEACLATALEIIGPNANLGDVGAAVAITAEDHGFRTIQNLTGHSLETFNLHAGLTVPATGMKVRSRPRIGDVLAVEPFVTDGTAGRVENSGPGNIYHFQRAAPQRLPTAKKLLSHVQRNHPKLPFAERWLEGAIPDTKLAFTLGQLQRNSLVKHYPALSEASGGMVSQREACIVITPDGNEVLTKL